MSDEIRKLYRSRGDRMLGGVCAGLGEYLKVDPTVVRIVAVLALFLTFATAALVYFAMWLIIPEEPVFVETKTEAS
jgi:phage shock protein C